MIAKAEIEHIIQLRAICHHGMIVKPQRKMSVISDVVGQKLKKIIRGLLGAAKTRAEKKMGNVNKRLNTPEIC